MKKPDVFINANCLGSGNLVFGNRQQNEIALKMCEGCACRPDCLTEWASLSYAVGCYGVWAGKMPKTLQERNRRGRRYESSALEELSGKKLSKRSLTLREAVKESKKVFLDPKNVWAQWGHDI